MLYILNIVIGCLYLSLIKISKWSELWKLLPIVLLWTLIAGAQDNVGADYPMYFSYFNHYTGVPNSRFEWMFALFSDWTIKLGFPGQGPFFTFAFINIVLLFIGGKVAKINHWALYYFLIITIATIFNNQMNGLRQATAVCLSFIAFLKFYDQKILAVILIIIAAGFHQSVLVCLPFIFIEPITNFTKRYPITLLIISFVSAFIDSATTDFNNQLLNLLPEWINENNHYKDAYTDSEYSHSTGLIYRISKIIFIPLYWKALYLIKSDKLTEFETKLFHFGFLSFMLRNLLLLNTLTGRLSFYFWIPSIFPLYYLMRDYWIKKDWIPFIVIVLWCVVPYIAKLVVGTLNYAHRFIYFS